MAGNKETFLKVCHLNAQSMEPHFSDIISIMKVDKVHILAISESWLKPKRSSKLFKVAGYNLFRRDRIGKRGGGVAIYVHESIKCTLVDQSNHPRKYVKRPEFLMLLLSFGHFNVLVSVVYSPPKCGYWSDVAESFFNCNIPYDYSILLGDFNINWNSASSPRSILRNFLCICSLTPLAFSPTHHSRNSESTIDYLCVSDISKVTHHEQRHCPYISQHDILLASFSFPLPAPKTRFISRRSFRNFNVDSFHQSLNNINWNTLTNMHDVNEKVEFFTSALVHVYDTHAPYKTFPARKNSSPWFNQDIKLLIRERNKCWREYKRFGRPTDFSEYKRLRNRVKTASRNAIATYYKTRFGQARGTSEMWKCVNELGVSSSKASTDFALPADLDTLNRHFAGNVHPTKLNDVRPTARISPDDRFYFKHVPAADVVQAITSARSNARGPDDIPVSFLRECLPFILQPLLNIFDSSLQSGVFPDAWKSAFVRPLPKCLPPLEVSHLRPISILCATSKIFESIVFNQISEFIDSNNLLDPFQSGFRKRHSTHTALVAIVDDIREAIDKEELVLAVAVDYSLAFDLVNIGLLIEKLGALGFSDSARMWVMSYLSNRTQCVVSNSGEISSPVCRNLGVPQGSPNGPGFFSLFINDAPSVLQHCKHHLYADDLTIYCRSSFDNLRETIDRVNSDLNSLSTWASANGLLINARKTQAIWFGSRSFISRLRNLNLPCPVMDNQLIPYCESVKLLGFTLDSTLSWTPQCVQTSRKAFSALARLRKCNDLIPHATKMQLVKALVFPYFDYSVGLLLDLSRDLYTKMQRCMNSAVRFATGVRKFDHITPHYVQNDLLPFTARRDYLCLCLLASILKYGEPKYLVDKFKFREPDKPGSKRTSVFDLVIKPARTDYFMSSFAIGVARLWNNLPVSVRAYYTRPCFKRLLLNHLLRIEANRSS